MAESVQKTRHFPCSQCGADVEFVPRVGLACPFCGHRAGIPENEDGLIEEASFDAYLARPKAGGYGLAQARDLRCAQCAATSRVSGDAAAARCAFCGAPIVVEDHADADVVRPEALIPFQITRDRARELFNEGIGGLWFAPTELRRLKEVDRIAGIYRPYWTFDAHTYSLYRGERGEHYYVTERYTATELVNGKTETVTKTRQVRRTRWYPASGHIDQFFDDELVCAGRETGWATAYDLRELCPYDPGYLAGWQAERYSLPPEQAWPKAKASIDRQIHGLVVRDIGGDDQRVHSIRTSYTAVRFKHILMPLYLASYFYGGKTYQFQVNGQSGAVHGERPYSFWKIFFFVLAILGAVGLIVLVVALAGGR